MIYRTPGSTGERVSARTAKAASTGRYEPFKTTSIFDDTANNPQWLGEEPPEVSTSLHGWTATNVLEAELPRRFERTFS